MYNKSLTLTFLLILSLTSCGAPEQIEKTELPAIPVTASLPTVKDVTIYLEALGTLQPSVLIEVRPQIEGPLIEVGAKEGEWVEEGTPLFKIDPKPYAIKVEEMEAQFAMDQADLNASQKKMVRIQPLAEKDLISQAEWEDHLSQVNRFETALLLDKARLNHARWALDNCTLRAPGAGRIGKIDAYPGLLVGKGDQDPLATLSQMDPLLVEFHVTEKEFFKMGKDLELTPLCSSENWNKAAKGTITFFDNHFDSKTGQLFVRGKIENNDHSLRPGQSVQVRVPIAIKERAILIPQKAIRYNQKGPYIYVIEEGEKVALRQVVLGEENGLDQEVLSGVDPTERIILEGHLRLSPGTKIEVKS